MRDKVALVADGFKISRMITSRAFTEYGLSDILEAQSGQETLNLIAGENPDIITIDTSFSDMNADVLIKEILKLNPQAKVLVISNSLDEGLINEYKSLGALDCIRKPFQPAMLFKRLDAVWGEREPEELNFLENVKEVIFAEDEQDCEDGDTEFDNFGSLSSASTSIIENTSSTPDSKTRVFVVAGDDEDFDDFGAIDFENELICEKTENETRNIHEDQSVFEKTVQEEPDEVFFEIESREEQNPEDGSKIHLDEKELVEQAKESFSQSQKLREEDENEAEEVFFEIISPEERREKHSVSETETESEVFETPSFAPPSFTQNPQKIQERKMKDTFEKAENLDKIISIRPPRANFSLTDIETYDDDKEEPYLKFAEDEEEEKSSKLITKIKRFFNK